LIQERIDLKISDTVMTSQERNKFRARRSKRMQSLKHSFKKVFVSHAQLAHFSTLAREKHMLLILNFSTLTFITNARTPMPFARLHSQMVCTQSEPAETPQHMFVQILVQVGGDRKRRTSRTTPRTPTPLVYVTRCTSPDRNYTLLQSNKQNRHKKERLFSTAGMEQDRVNEAPSEHSNERLCKMM